MSEQSKVLCGGYYFPHLLPRYRVLAVEAVMESRGVKELPAMRLVKREAPVRRRYSGLRSAVLMGAMMGMR